MEGPSPQDSTQWQLPPAHAVGPTLLNGDFGNGLDFWQVEISPAAQLGEVVVENGAAVFRENGSLLSTLQQSFVLPAGSTEFCFDLVGSNFDLGDQFIPDAFEVSLVDANTLQTVVDPWAGFATSFWNLQEDGAVNLGPTTTFDGTTVAVSLENVPAGSELTVFIDLIGGDNDLGSEASIDNVRIIGISANPRGPGSVLVYPVHRRAAGGLSILSVTNTNTEGAGFGNPGGTTNVRFEYVSATPGTDPFLPANCHVVGIGETLTPADTLTLLTACHLGPGTEPGYAIVTATDPFTGGTGQPWSFDYLVGSELVFTPTGGAYSLNARAFQAFPQVPERQHTDVDGDGRLDFNDIEYSAIAETLILDSFVATLGSHLTLINLSGGLNHEAVVEFDIWNDDETPLSSTLTFRCWFDEPLMDVSPVFSPAFLENIPNDPGELDLNCDGLNDLETGWAKINGAVVSSASESLPNPALLGAITASTTGLNGARELWESAEKQDNGQAFLP